MKNIKQKIKCPLCNGKGFYLKKKNKNAILIPELRMRGLTYREIMKITGIKSLDSIHYYLVRNRKQGPWHKNRSLLKRLWKKVIHSQAIDKVVGYVKMRKR